MPCLHISEFLSLPIRYGNGRTAHDFNVKYWNPGTLTVTNLLGTDPQEKDFSCEAQAHRCEDMETFHGYVLEEINLTPREKEIRITKVIVYRNADNFSIPAKAGEQDES